MCVLYLYLSQCVLRLLQSSENGSLLLMVPGGHVEAQTAKGTVSRRLQTSQNVGTKPGSLFSQLWCSSGFSAGSPSVPVVNTFSFSSTTLNCFMSSINLHVLAPAAVYSDKN